MMAFLGFLFDSNTVDLDLNIPATRKCQQKQTKDTHAAYPQLAIGLGKEQSCKTKYFQTIYLSGFNTVLQTSSGFCLMRLNQKFRLSFLLDNNEALPRNITGRYRNIPVPSSQDGTSTCLGAARTPIPDSAATGCLFLYHVSTQVKQRNKFFSTQK